VPFVYQNPALHRHCATDELPVPFVTAVVPHDVHAVAPDTLEYVFAGQFVQLEPTVEYLPAAHCVHAVLPASDDDPAGHAKHDALDVFPAPDRYRFNSDEAVSKASLDRCLFQT